MKTDIELKQDTPFARLPLYLNTEQTDLFEKGIDQKLAKYDVPYLSRTKNKGKNGKSAKTLDDILYENYKIYSGGNRQGALLSYIDKLLLHLKAKSITASLDQIKQMAMDWNKKHCVPPVEQGEFDVKVRESIKFVELKTGFIEGEQELINELEGLGVSVERFLEEKSLTESVRELRSLITNHALKHDTPKDPNIAADEILKKYPNMLKTLNDTDEMLFFNGKIYEIYGDKVVKQELERMRKEEQNVSMRLGELAEELSRMIVRRNNAGKSTDRAG